MSERKAVFLVGPMGAGKSTLGRQLGYKFSGGFVDLDDYIVKVAGKSIPKIFEEDGEPYFRQLEHDCLEAILTGKSERIPPEHIRDPLPSIIAGGGGVAMREDNRALIKAHTLCMYLYLDVDKQYARVKGDSNRPMIKVDDVRQRLSDLFATRDPQYREIATIVLDSSESFKGILHRAANAIKIRELPGIELKRRDCHKDGEQDASAQASSSTSILASDGQGSAESTDIDCPDDASAKSCGTEECAKSADKDGYSDANAKSNGTEECSKSADKDGYSAVNAKSCGVDCGTEECAKSAGLECSDAACDEKACTGAADGLVDTSSAADRCSIGTQAMGPID